MRKYTLISLFLFIIMPSTASATKPCMPPDKQWFLDNVMKKSDLVVYASIEDYSGSVSNVFGKKWTEIKVIKVLHGELNNSKELTIWDWQAHDYPLYVHEKASLAIFWLKENEGKYYITDLSWQYCVPSVWNADENKTAYNLISKKLVSLQEIENLIAEAFVK